MARAVVPSATATVDHANIELIGHDGKLETPGFFAVEQSACLYSSNLNSQTSILSSDRLQSDV